MTANMRQHLLWQNEQIRGLNQIAEHGNKYEKLTEEIESKGAAGLYQHDEVH